MTATTMQETEVRPQGKPESFVSADGTRLAGVQYGSGAPLVLVHGSGADRNRWTGVTAALARELAVHTYDRRGRGDSQDGPSYSLEREAEDLLALLHGIGAPADVVAHSYGALCALSAAAMDSRLLRRLVLYEAPLPPQVGLDDAIVQRLSGLLRDGDCEGLVAAFFLEVLHVSAKQLAALKQTPQWAARVAEASTIPRELAAQNAFSLDPTRFRALKSPVTLLLGGASPPPFRAAAERLARDLPQARVTVLPGQAHGAMDSAPDLFVATVLDLLKC
ncbi:MAG TPA: alpha/beta hydrolase [Thermoanaerobaculia bacterium]|nr:alpha/beta hydrolase [Thermoanaerobaculia bacterium]